MLKACSISYTVHLVTPCVCVRGTVNTFFRPWQILWGWHFCRHYFRFSKLLSKHSKGSKEHYLLGLNTMCESLIKRITPKICMLCFALINSILCNLLCVRVLFENANSACFRFFLCLLYSSVQHRSHWAAFRCVSVYTCASSGSRRHTFNNKKKKKRGIWWPLYSEKIYNSEKLRKSITMRNWENQPWGIEKINQYEELRK